MSLFTAVSCLQSSPSAVRPNRQLSAFTVSCPPSLPSAVCLHRRQLSALTVSCLPLPSAVRRHRRQLSAVAQSLSPICLSTDGLSQVTQSLSPICRHAFCHRSHKFCPRSVDRRSVTSHRSQTSKRQLPWTDGHWHTTVHRHMQIRHVNTTCRSPAHTCKLPEGSRHTPVNYLQVTGTHL